MYNEAFGNARLAVLGLVNGKIQHEVLGIPHLSITNS